MSEEIDTDAVKAIILISVMIIILIAAAVFTYEYFERKPYRIACMKDPEILYDGNCPDTKTCLEQCIQTQRTEAG